MGEELIEISLRTSGRDREASFDIPRAVVRRVENRSPGEVFCAIEFLEMPEGTRELFWHHLFEEERTTLQRTKKS